MGRVCNNKLDNWMRPAIINAVPLHFASDSHGTLLFGVTAEQNGSKGVNRNPHEINEISPIGLGIGASERPRFGPGIARADTAGIGYGALGGRPC